VKFYFDAVISQNRANGIEKSFLIEPIFNFLRKN
jgi:hypothetical protein